jgi:predicted nucleic-acid-binding protein
MVAVDTNIIVRYLTDDDPAQSAIAKSVLKSQSIWIAKTVLLETAWVLRSAYRYSQPAIWNALTGLLGLPNLHAEDEVAVAAALALVGQGMDLADALHVASKPAGDAFLTFDQDLVRVARRVGLGNVTPPAVTRRAVQ